MEQLYCKYYAQVKGNLLPTAIQVVLLVNILQLLATLLYYFLPTIAQQHPATHHSHHSKLHQQQPSPSPSPAQDLTINDSKLPTTEYSEAFFNSNHEQVATSTPTSTSTFIDQSGLNSSQQQAAISWQQHQYSSSPSAHSNLWVQLCLQLTVLIITFAMLHRVKAHLKARRANKYKRRRLSSSSRNAARLAAASEPGSNLHGLETSENEDSGLDDNGCYEGFDVGMGSFSSTSSCSSSSYSSGSLCSSESSSASESENDADNGHTNDTNNVSDNDNDASNNNNKKNRPNKRNTNSTRQSDNDELDVECGLKKHDELATIKTGNQVELVALWGVSGAASPGESCSKAQTKTTVISSSATQNLISNNNNNINNTNRNNNSNTINNSSNNNNNNTNNLKKHVISASSKSTKKSINETKTSIKDDGSLATTTTTKKRQNHKHHHRNSRHSASSHHHFIRRLLRDRKLILLPYLLWLCQLIQLASGFWPQQSFISYSILLLYSYTIYVIIPIRLTSCLLMALGLALFKPLVDHLISLNNNHNLSSQQQHSSAASTSFINRIILFLLVLAINLIGFLSYLYYERQQRAAFLETRQSLETKLILEQESEEQERLLLSILPEHLATQIRKDLGAVMQCQFKKIYMSRYEEVSILFADIVGFTAISSHCQAAELVKILNELFARFDKLAEKYHQMRIKILGDCYYAISGAPEKRPDHAVLCVHMGLSMVEAIRSVREKTNSTVDMRVGVHTGAVLAGVLGQRQWQFDVYSKDVELANKMESSGLPGRVHISNATLRFLNDEFVVSEADGESREESLRMANIKTYFIERVRKPYPQGTLDDVSSQTKQQTNQGDKNNNNINPSVSIDMKNAEKSQDIRASSKKRRRRVKKARSNRANSKFRNSNNGDSNRGDQKQQQQSSNLDDNHNSDDAICDERVALRQQEQVQKIQHKQQQQQPQQSMMNDSLSFKIDNNCIGQFDFTICLAAIMVLIWLLAHLIAAVSQQHQANGGRLLSVEVFNYFAIACSLAITAITHISFLVKTMIIVLVVLIQVIINFTFLSRAQIALATYSIDKYHYNQYIFTLTLVCICWALFLINRKFELTTRNTLVWRKQAEQRKERVADIRQKNEALVYNILPPNVAKIFLGKRIINDDELYSKSYEAVGVLFAAMPNFSNFYTEESVNNQGLECLRFLNEVISDYDALLDQPRFKNIIKIKTMGSTYMAASGLYEGDAAEIENNNITNCLATKPSSISLASSSNMMQDNNNNSKSGPHDGGLGASSAHPAGPDKCSHLVQLTEFALALKETLNNINKESFNNFVLRIGINHGPITAGVIGAKKPHFDMWGNTVNVASRMETTAETGRIQITDDVYQILKEFNTENKYKFTCRGSINVKGKGHMTTHYLDS